jgi:hypothetical protein
MRGKLFGVACGTHFAPRFFLVRGELHLPVHQLTTLDTAMGIAGKFAGAVVGAMRGDAIHGACGKTDSPPVFEVLNVWPVVAVTEGASFLRCFAV